MLVLSVERIHGRELLQDDAAATATLHIQRSQSTINIRKSQLGETVA